MEEFQKVRKPGSVRLTNEQYQEMEQLGLNNESAYVKYKLNHARNHMQVVKKENSKTDSTPDIQAFGKSTLEDQLALQRLRLENQQLKEKLDVLSLDREETLNGVRYQVNNLLKDELLKRDFEASKEENSLKQKRIEKLEKQLEKANDTIEGKNGEIEELVKKLGLVELGKALLPGAVSSLARRYPREMQGLAATLGDLGDTEGNHLPPAALDEDKQYLLNIAEYIRELFTDEQFEQVIQIVSQLGEQVKEDDTMIGKVMYYLNQMGTIRKSRKQQDLKKEKTEEQGQQEV